MNCCGCAPLAVETIYNKVDAIERRGLVPANICAATRSRLLEFTAWRTRLRPDIHVTDTTTASEDRARKVA